MNQSTRKQRGRKVGARPAKPYPEFPLYTHPLGYWSKKIRGTIEHFGRWGRVVNGKLTALPYEASWREALIEYKATVDDIQAGRSRRRQGDALTVRDLCNHFCNAKKRKLEASEISPRTFAEYKNTTDRLMKVCGRARRVADLAPMDFERVRASLAVPFGPVRLGNEITKVKSVFRYAAENGLIDRPVRFGSEFRKPGKAVLRRHKAANGGNMMESDEIRKLLDALTGKETKTGERDKKTGKPVKVRLDPRPDVRAMLMLMVNCGFGPTDCATLPIDAVDLVGGWIDFPRPKTGIARRCPLWPETVGALKAALKARPRPHNPDEGKFMFLTARGRKCISGNTANPITILVTNAMKAIRLHREGRGPYTLQHVFRTVADAALDRVAIDLIMGHSDSSMGGQYRERIDDNRLTAVSEHVRHWLFPSAKAKTPAP